MKKVLLALLLILPQHAFAQSTTEFSFSYSFDRLGFFGEYGQSIPAFSGSAVYAVNSFQATQQATGMFNNWQNFTGKATQDVTSTISGKVWKPSEVGPYVVSTLAGVDIINKSNGLYSGKSMVGFSTNYYHDNPENLNQDSVASLSITGDLSYKVTNDFNRDFIASALMSIGTGFTVASGVIDFSDSTGHIQYVYSGHAALNKIYTTFNSQVGTGDQDSPIMPTSVEVNNVSGDAVVEYGFIVDTQSGEMTFIDPIVAVGYDYTVQDGALVERIQLPNIGDGRYNIYTFDSDGTMTLVQKDWNYSDIFDFAGPGVSKFRIDGIEIGAGLSPDDFTAFNTGMQFAADGRHNITMTALTFDTDLPVATPEPGTILLMGLGMAGAAFIRRRITIRVM